MSDIGALKAYLGEGKHGRALKMDELKELTKEERAELAVLVRAELGE